MEESKTSENNEVFTVDYYDNLPVVDVEKELYVKQE